MKRFAGIAAIAVIAHAGLAWAQPVIVAPDDGPGRAERPTSREAPTRAPAEAERGSPQRMETPSRERREVQSKQPRGQDAERPQEQQREHAERDRSPDSGSKRAQPQHKDRTPERSEAQRPEGNRATERAQQPNGRPSNGPETAQPRQPDNRSAPATARPAQTDPNRSDSASQSQGTNPQPQAGAQPRETGQEQRSQTANQPPAQADNQRIAASVREQIDRDGIRPVRDFGVSVTVGARLPSRVDLRPLPGDIASLRPQYRNYRYTVSDRQIVIVDPGSRRIVEVIDRDGGRGGGALYAAFEHQRDVRRWRRPSAVVFRAGIVLPTDVPLHALPVEIVERHPDWRDYRYVMTETDEVAIVEPRTHRIVQVVDKDAPQSASAAAGSTDGGSRSAPSDDRHELARIILQDAKPGEIQGIDGLKGAVLPNELALRPLPSEVEQRDAQLRGYQYTLIGDDVLIVDPQTRRIVDVIE